MKATITARDQRKIAKLIEEIKDRRNTIEEIERPAREALAQSLVGLCVRFSNSYGGPRKKNWYGYVKVQSAKGGELSCLRFEDRPDCVLITPGEWFAIPTIQGYETISPDEFRRQYLRVLQKLSSMEV